MDCRLPCPLQSTGVCSNSCPLSWWCYLTISSSVTPYLFPSIFSNIRTWLHQVVKILELHLQHQYFQWIFKFGFLEDWLIWSPCSSRDSQGSSPAPQFESISSLELSLLYGLSHLYMTNGKNIALTLWTFVSKVISAFEYTMFAITFLPRHKHLLISWLQSLSAVNVKLKKLNSVTLSIFPHLFPMKW